MKKSILFILVAGASIFIFIGASKYKIVNDKVNNKSSLTSDIDPTGCWTRDTANLKEILTFHFLIDSGPHKHYFYVENFFDVQCPVSSYILWPGAIGAIGTMDGFKFSYTTEDTTFYTGLITDTTPGQKRMEVYSQTDTTVFFGQ